MNFLSLNEEMMDEKKALLEPLSDNGIKYFWYSYKTPMARETLFKQPEQVLTFSRSVALARRVFVAGNGGSLSTAEHIALDWSKRGGKMVVPLAGSGQITAWGNDHSFEDIFVNQLKQYGIEKQDVIVLLSASGQSPNIVNVIKRYFPDKATIIGMTGKLGTLKETLPICLSVDSIDPQIIEDAHLCYGHVISNILKANKETK